MGLLYNIGIRCYTAAIATAGVANAKARLWREGRRGLLERIEGDMAHETRARVWIHAASLG